MAAIVTKPITLEEFEQLPRDGNKHELSEGELITMPPPKFRHSDTVATIWTLLQLYLREARLGKAFAEAGFVLSRDPLTVREPDIAVVRYERIRETDPDGYVQGAPELAVEVVSPSDSAEDLDLKTKQYLEAGAKQVWVVYPATRKIYVYRPDSLSVLDESQTLTAPDILPGFSVSVADLFT